ncbi:helix-turn-helix domain-containing protein [Streptomyces scabiei]|uniref:helix-turn-helix domain-containing protein n=1 Tax=Streptomyces scabiei TaxID=1930 RepID=UPI0036C19B20
MAQSPMPSHPRRRDGKTPLPAPEERARLRRAWGLTEGQVADAFGVAVATVRSWEAGRSAPPALPSTARPAPRATRRRRIAPAPAQCRLPAAGPDDRKAAEPAVHRGSAVLSGRAPAQTGRPVGPGHDPVAPARLRRLRILTAAVGVWIAVGYLMATTPAPHL